MVKVKDILENLNALAPMETKMDFDNVGLLVGDGEAPVHRALLALDAADKVIQEAQEKKAQLILTHHPLFFSLKRVNREDPVGARILALAENGIAEISMHTNLDAAAGGVNDALAAAIGLKQVTALCCPEPGGRVEAMPRIGFLERPQALKDWLPGLRQALAAPGLRFYDGGRAVEKVGVLGGSGGDEAALLAAAGCDTVVTADIKYHIFQQAGDLGINLVDAGHFETETVVLKPLLAHLEAAFPEVDFSIASTNGGVVQFI